MIHGVYNPLVGEMRGCRQQLTWIPWWPPPSNICSTIELSELEIDDDDNDEGYIEWSKYSVYICAKSVIFQVEVASDTRDSACISRLLCLQALDASMHRSRPRVLHKCSLTLTHEPSNV